MVKDKLIFPHEIDLWYILPTIRKEFALELMEQKISQKRIALMLGITEASVSHYKKEQRANEVDLGKELKNEIRNSVKMIIDNKSTMFNEIMRIDSLVKSSGLLCKIHKQKCKNLGECSECKKLYARK
jgi:predicted transcriptional regulator